MDGRAFAITVGYVLFGGLYVYLVVWPFLPWTLLVGSLGGLVLALATMLHALATGHARLVGPDDVDDGALLPPHASAYGRDRAWPHYLARQAREDLAAAVRRVRTLVARCWSAAWFLEDVEIPAPVVPLVLLLAVLPWTLGAAATIGALVGVLAVLAVTVPVLFLAIVVWGTVALVLRWGDARLRRHRRAVARCPSCFWVTRLPSYPCGCGVVHHDVRPSRLGVWWHRCRCGRSIPTTVSRAGAVLAPSCPQCLTALEPGSGIVTDLSVPVFGAVSAGKTSLLHAGLAALAEAVGRADGHLRPCGVTGERRYREGVEQARAGTVAATPERPPEGLVLEVTLGGRTVLLHTFDASGVHFTNRERSAAMRFLDHAGHLVLVVDPFAVARVADELDGGERPIEVPVGPESVYHATVLRLRDHGVDLSSMWLAVVVAKADLLIDTPPARGLRPDSTSVRTWLVEHGQDHLVLQAERDFRGVAYFLVSSRGGDDPTAPLTALAPLRWLAGHGHLTVPIPRAPRPDETEPARPEPEQPGAVR